MRCLPSIGPSVLGSVSLTEPHNETHRRRASHSTKARRGQRGQGATPNVRAMSEADQAFLQENQPEGVPPLALTGERTLPDVPEENYWYRRHVAVYEWIAGRCAGLRVADLACGEGYGSDLLASEAAEVVGVDANPEA